LGNVSKYGEVLVEAAAPVIEKTADKILPVVTKEADKAIQAGIGTVVNLAEDIAGPFIGIPRTILSAAEAFNASVNAGSELIKGTSEVIQGTQENMNRILNKNMTKLTEISQIPQIPTPKPIPQIPTQPISEFKTMQSVGGSLKKYQNEAIKIGGRVNKSQIEFLSPSIILQQRNTTRRQRLRRKLTPHRH